MRQPGAPRPRGVALTASRRSADELAMNPLVLQAGVAGPLVLGLAIYSAARSSQGLVHRYLFFLLLLILSWMTGMVAPSAGLDPSGIWVQALVLPPTVAMAPQRAVQRAQKLGIRSVLGPFIEYTATVSSI